MFIYLLTNTKNGKHYVGQTTGTVDRRVQGHKDRSRGPRAVRSAIAHAIAKYGWSAFTVETLEECHDDADLDMAERFWIDVYGSMAPDGYNLMTGGSTNKRHSPESIEKIRAARLGLTFSGETRAKMRSAHLGHTVTDENRLKISGENHYRARLTWEIVGAIRAQAAAGVTQKELARRYGVNQSAICRIVRNERWIVPLVSPL